ncbi:MAG: ABC transporter permease [Planctomycetota bacterium]|nr:MAG: ABC transporter permease [Planctomycetota bacterium]
MLRLALAYLFRRPVQVLAVLGVAVGLLALLSVLAVMNGLIESDRERARGPLSDLLLIPAISETVFHFEDYRRILTDVDEVDAVAPHLVAYAILGLTGGESFYSRTRSSDLNGVQIVGIDAQAELEVSGLRKSLQEAKRFPVVDLEKPFHQNWEFGSRPGVLVSDDLARVLSIKLGEKIELGALPPVLPEKDEEFIPHNGRFTVVGTYASLDYGVGMDRIYVNRLGERDGLRFNLLDPGFAHPDFTEILIKLRPGISFSRGIEAIRLALIQAGMPEPGGPLGGSLESWEGRRRVYLNAIENERRVITLILFFIVVVAAFGLFATLSALVREKIRDLGILAALGFPPWQRGLLLLFVGALGSAAGTLLGYGGAWLLYRHRVSVETFLEDKLGIQVFPDNLYVVHGLPAHWIPEQAQFLAVAAFATGILFTLAPALRAAWLSPVEALRYE